MRRASGASLQQQINETAGRSIRDGKTFADELKRARGSVLLDAQIAERGDLLRREHGLRFDENFIRHDRGGRVRFDERRGRESARADDDGRGGRSFGARCGRRVSDEDADE